MTVAMYNNLRGKIINDAKQNKIEIIKSSAFIFRNFFFKINGTVNVPKRWNIIKNNYITIAIKSHFERYKQI